MLDGLKITGVALTTEGAIDIIESAINAGHTYGFGYWGVASRVRTNDKRVVAYDITEHEPYTNEEKARTRKVNTAEIKDAVRQMLIDPKGTESEAWTHRLLDDSGIDGPLAEAIVQVACFGKVIYG